MPECGQHALKLEELHEDVRSIASYVPKIEAALERLLHVQDTLRSFAEVHKELFSITRKQQESLNKMEIERQKIEGRVFVLEESRKGIIAMLTPVGTVIIVALLLIVVVYMVSHQVIPGQVTTGVKP